MNILFQKSNQRVFGTFPLKGEELAASLDLALKFGYRAFDSAQMYGNERDVGSALKFSGINRDDLCIITKVHPENYSQNAFLPSVEKSMKDLEIDQIDVLLLHWPPADGDIRAPLKLLQKAYNAKLAKNIGVSNFTSTMMAQISTIVSAPITCNQVEFHPLLDQGALMKSSVETGIPLMAYCSIARGEIFKHSLLDDIAKSYEKTSAQIVQRWILQKGVVVNTMSTKSRNIQANFEVMDFTLSSPDMARLDSLNKVNYRIVTSDLAPWAPEWDPPAAG
ncbi:MAG: aldo/keto reductase [Roseovarius sp.]|nr:aldo/keto reductase [Roseovarius sp.]